MLRAGGNARHRPKHPATRQHWQNRRILIPRSYAAGEGCVTAKHASAVAHPPRSDGQRLELVKGVSPRGLTHHCTDKAGRIHSSPLYICQAFLFLLRQRRGAAGLGELQIGVGPYFANFFAKFRPFFEKKNFREI